MRLRGSQPERGGEFLVQFLGLAIFFPSLKKLNVILL